MPTPFDLLSDGLKQYVVAPAAAFGLGGLIFDVEGDTVNNLSTEITDHYLEDNSSVQDHISIRPKRITLRRYVGEIIYTPDTSGILTDVQQVVQKLTTLSSFLPTLSQGATQIFNIKSQDITFNALQNTINSTTVNQLTDFYAFSKNLLGQDSRQAQVYSYLKSLMEQRILMSVQTPWEFINNMAIETLTAVQPEGSAYITEFSVTLKQIRFASLITAPTGSIGTVVSGDIGNPETTLNPAADQAQPAVLQGAAAVQAQPLQNNGVVNGTTKAASGVLQNLFKQNPGVLLPPPNLH